MIVMECLLIVCGILAFIIFGHHFFKQKDKEYILMVDHNKLVREIGLQVLWIKYFLNPEEGKKDEKNTDNIQT